MNFNVYILEYRKDNVSSPSLLDTATMIAISAIKPKVEKGKKRGGEGKEQGKEGEKPAVDRTTINNLLTFLQNSKNVNELLVYIMRQMGRKEIDEETGKLLLRNLKDKSVDEALTLLGYVKWIYETLDGLKKDYNSVRNVRNFEGLVEILSK